MIKKQAAGEFVIEKSSSEERKTPYSKKNKMSTDANTLT